MTIPATRTSCALFLSLIVVSQSAYADLIAHWDFDNATEIAAQLLSDAAGAKNDTMSLNGPTSDGASAVGTGALAFDGVDDFASVTIGGADLPTTVGEIPVNTGTFRSRTLSLWVKVGPSVSGLEIMQSDFRVTTRTGAAQPADNGLEWAVSDSGKIPSGASALDGNWHHMVGTYETSTSLIRLYYDGAEIGSGVTASSLSFMGDTSITISNNAGFRFIGSLDDMAIWNETLTAAQAIAIYEMATEFTFNYDAAEMESMFDAFATTSDVVVDGTTWTYATGLGGADGELVDVGGGDFTLNLGGGAGFTTVNSSSSIPEPSSAILSVLAMLGLSCRSLRRRRR